MAKAYKRILIIADQHSPFNHKDYFSFLLKLKREVNPDLEEFMAAYEFSNTEDKKEVTLTVKSEKPFTGISLEAVLKCFIEAYANDFDKLLDNEIMLQ